MSVCPNCNKKLSCGCQRRTASNKVAVCNGCLVSYEQALKSGSQPGTVYSDFQSNVGRYKNLQKFIKT